MDDHQGPALVEVTDMFLEMDEAIRRLLDAQSIIESELHTSYGEDRLTLQEVYDTLDQVVQVLEDLNA